MGFLPQFYIIKDALLDNRGFGVLISGSSTSRFSVRTPITDIFGRTFNEIYSPKTSNSTASMQWYHSMFLFCESLETTSNNFNIEPPVKIWVSEDADADKLKIDSTDHSVALSFNSCHKLYENGKNYTSFTYTNTGESFDIATIRLAVDIYTSSGSKSDFIIYSEPIDPITIGTGETVQIKIEV